MRILKELFLLSALVVLSSPAFASCDKAAKEKEAQEIFMSRATVSEAEGEKLLKKLDEYGKAIKAHTDAGEDDEACEVMDEAIEYLKSFPAK